MKILQFISTPFTIFLLSFKRGIDIIDGSILFVVLLFEIGHDVGDFAFIVVQVETNFVERVPILGKGF